MKVVNVFIAFKVYNKRVLYAHPNVVDVRGESITGFALLEFSDVHISSDDGHLIP